MKITPASKLTFKYLALPHGIGGRGGVQRFFLLSQGIAFQEQIMDMATEWPQEKERLLASGENPCASVPMIYQDDEPLPILQHIAGSRLLAKVHDCGSGDIYLDYLQDMVADEYQGFRDTWVHMTFAGTDEEKAEYKKTGLPKQLTKFNSLYEKHATASPYLSLSKKTQQPLWGDAAIFGLLRDHILTGHMTKEVLESYPSLNSLFESYEKIPAVAAWIESATK